MNKFDVVIVGAGIVGAATAWQLIQNYPNKKILLLEKESAPALHQTGRNSGVIHAGVYYPPGSFKAKFCKQGLADTIAFCQQYKLPYLQCGKLLVACNDSELTRMEGLYQRSIENNLSPQRLDESNLRKVEPNIRGLGGILIKDTGITDYNAITQTMLGLFAGQGGTIEYGQQVTALEENESGVKVNTQLDSYSAKLMVNCAGLQADRLIKLMGIDTDFQIVPFRGEYFKLPAKYNNIVKHLIYPIPDPSLPFLGVHLTRMIDGSVTVGPNAVLALGREAYNKSQLSFGDMYELLKFKGALPLFMKHGKSGISEMKNSWLKTGYLKRVQRYCPQLELEDLLSYPSGIRAQAVSSSGELIHDFKFVETEHSMHVGNAPSPAATSAIPIAKSIVSSLEDKLA